MLSRHNRYVACEQHYGFVSRLRLFAVAALASHCCCVHDHQSGGDRREHGHGFEKGASPGYLIAIDAFKMFKTASGAHADHKSRSHRRRRFRVDPVQRPAQIPASRAALHLGYHP